MAIEMMEMRKTKVHIQEKNKFLNVHVLYFACGVYSR